MNDVFNEVTEELKQDQLISFFKKYGKWVATIILLALFTVGGYNFWQSRLNAQYKTETDTLLTLLNSALEGKTNEEIAVELSKLGEDKKFHLSYLADFYAMNGSTENAASITELETQIDVILKNSNTPKLYADFARLLKAISIINVGNSTEVEQYLSVLLNPKNPWYFSATELMGFNFLQQNDLNKAEPYFRTLVENTETPNLIRERAVQTLSVIHTSKLEN